MKPTRSLLTIGVACAATLALTAVPAHAQFLSHNYKGDFGVLAGTQPAPGTYLAGAYVRYDIDTLRDGDGNSIAIDPEEGGFVDVNGYALGFWHVTDFKILGGNYSFMAFPAVSDALLSAPILGLAQKVDTGFSDLYFQPINLGWHKERADFVAAFGLVAPTGRFDPDASDNLGLGMWSFELSAGTTVYFDEAKSWHFATAGFYEMHSKKQDTDIRVGDILTLEGGLGKSFMEGAFTIGLAYDAQWKVTADDVGDLQPVFDALGLRKHRVFGAGPEITFPIATKEKLIALVTARYTWEFGARSTVEGNSFVLVATFPIPSVPLK